MKFFCIMIYTVIDNLKEYIMNELNNAFDKKEPIITSSWIGQSGKEYRSIKYWVGAGYSASFLQYKDDLGNWVYE